MIRACLGPSAGLARHPLQDRIRYRGRLVRL